MSEVKRKCKYKSSITGWECPYEALEDSKEGFCVFHERRKDKDIKKFNEGIEKILQDKDSDAYHFEGFFFPDSVSFRKFKFKKTVYFCDAQFMGKQTDFSLTEFAEIKSFFTGAEFSGEHTTFYGAKFLGPKTYTDFEWAEFSSKKTDFAESKFSGVTTNFSQARFTGEKTEFIRCKFSARNTYFFDTRFSSENIYFFGAEFSGQNTVFNKAKFSGGNNSFSLAEFLGEEVNFYFSEFLKKIRFDRTIFKAKANFTGVDLRKCIFTEVDLKNVDFSLVEWDWSYKLKNEMELPFGITLEESKEIKQEQKHQFYFKTSEIYGQLKVQFHNKRDFAKAGMFHFREQECKRMACELPKDFFKWIFLWILKLSCGYGEKLRNVGLSSVALILIFGIIYMFIGLHAADQNETLIFKYKIAFKNTAPIWTIIKDYLTSVSFSLKGFFPLWRFQQYKLVGDFANLVAGIEFLLGAFFIGLFIYVFRRRMEK